MTANVNLKDSIPTTSKTRIETLYFREIVEKYNPAYGGNWNRYLKDEFYRSSPVVKILREEYNKFGKFQNPIILAPDEDEEDGVLYVYNGMHRLLVHYMEDGFNSLVKVQYGHSAEDVNTHWLDVNLYFRRPLTDYELDDLMEFASWRHGDPDHPIWIEQGILECSKENGTISLCFDKGSADTDLVVSEFKARISHLAEVVSYEWSK